MEDLPPVIASRDAVLSERLNLRQLSIALRDAQHAVSSLQSLHGQARAKYQRLDLIRALQGYIFHIERLGGELETLLGGDDRGIQ